MVSKCFQLGGRALHISSQTTIATQNYGLLREQGLESGCLFLLAMRHQYVIKHSRM